MIVGIDLGTTNSLIGYWNEIEAILIPNSLGNLLTPSVIGIDDNGLLLIGEPAFERLLTHPDLTVANFKRYIGSEKKIRLGEKVFTPEELSSFVIRRLIEDAEDFLGLKIDEAVISVPAYFNDTQRKMTRMAGELAGIKVERLINEPTAAGLSYGLHQQDMFQQFLVFDLGGGTFDISILELFEGIMEIKATTGDNFLGGEDFTKCLMDEFINKTQIGNHLADENLKSQLMPLIRHQAELCKQSFGKSSNVSMNVQFDGNKYEWNFLESEMQKIFQPLVNRIRQVLGSAIRDSKINVQDLHQVILVGGATRMPLIKTLVARHFGKLPLSHINPDEAVGKGAAIQAGLKMRSKTLQEIVVTDVCPYTLGIKTVISKSMFKTNIVTYTPIIERNTVIPASKIFPFCTVQDNQIKIKIEVYQGESPDLMENIFLGMLEVSIPPAPAGVEQIHVRFTYDINGLLEVEVTVVSTQVTRQLVIENNKVKMDPDSIKRRLNELKSIKIHPRDEIVNRSLCAKLEKFYAICLNAEREYIGKILWEFKALLETQDIEEIKKGRSVIQERLKQFQELVGLIE